MWFLLAGCQEPFGADRHDLVGFRVAAVSAPATAPGGAFVPRAAVVVDGRAWSGTPVALSWGFVADPDEAGGDVPFEATGAEPSLQLPADRRTLVLSARHGDEERRAFLTLAPPPAVLAPPPGFDVGPVDLPDRPEGPELLLDARARLTPGEGRTVAPRGWLRLAAPVDEQTTLRWMATAGTFLELDPGATDWTAADGLRLDEDELDDPGAPVAPGPVTVLALALRAGETAFAATELFVGDAPEGVWIGSRWAPADDVPAPAPGLVVRTTLREDPDAPSGVRLEGGRTLSRATVTDWGTPDLSCTPAADGPLDLDWFLTQRCSPVGADGVEVVAEVSAAPPGAAP